MYLVSSGANTAYPKFVSNSEWRGGGCPAGWNSAKYEGGYGERRWRTFGKERKFSSSWANIPCDTRYKIEVVHISTTAVDKIQVNFKPICLSLVVAVMGRAPWAARTHWMAFFQGFGRSLGGNFCPGLRQKSRLGHKILCVNQVGFGLEAAVAHNNLPWSILPGIGWAGRPSKAAQKVLAGGGMVIGEEEYSTAEDSACLAKWGNCVFLGVGRPARP